MNQEKRSALIKRVLIAFIIFGLIFAGAATNANTQTTRFTPVILHEYSFRMSGVQPEIKVMEFINSGGRRCTYSYVELRTMAGGVSTSTQLECN